MEATGPVRQLFQCEYSYFQESALDSQEVLKECLDKFSTPDYIMEPGIFTQLKRWAIHKDH